MNERILILGSTGLLGQSLLREAESRQVEHLGVARGTKPYAVDVTDKAALKGVIESYRPTVVINTVALVSLPACETDPALAEAINANPLLDLVEMAKTYNFYLVQISTDHYFAGDGTRRHAEEDPVVLLNEYARTKHLAEEYALADPNASVIRTNIVGFRRHPGQPTFVESVIESCEQGKPMTLFDDYFTSSIDVTSFSRLLFDLLPKRPKGRLNLASQDVFSKKEFVEQLVLKLGRDLSFTTTGSVFDMPGNVKRAESLGLDVTKAGRLLGVPLPTLDNVIDQLVSEYKALALSSAR